MLRVRVRWSLVEGMVGKRQVRLVVRLLRSRSPLRQASLTKRKRPILLLLLPLLHP